MFTYTLKYNTYCQGKGSWGRVRMGLCADSTAKGDPDLRMGSSVAKVFPRLLPLMACKCYTSSSQLGAFVDRAHDAAYSDTRKSPAWMLGHHTSSTALAVG